jgi:hypothetical protein
MIDYGFVIVLASGLQLTECMRFNYAVNGEKSYKMWKSNFKFMLLG